MSGDRAVIVEALPSGRYIARVVEGTIESYYPSGLAKFTRRTPERAKKRAECWIAHEAKANADRRRREQVARQVTGYDS